MTIRRRRETRRCLEIIENFQEVQFEESSFRNELDVSEVTSVHENPERLTIPDDFSLLFHVLSRQIAMENYEDPLEVCRRIVNSEFSGQVEQKINELFTSLLAQLLSEERKEKKKIDPHVILSWLDTGELHFCKENHKVLLNRKAYAILKAVHLVKTWKSKYECYSCGCIQKQIIELFRGNNCSRLFEALHSIVKDRITDLNPTMKRLIKSISTNIQPIDYFCYYTEIVQELKQCSAIDLSDEKSPSLLIQLTGLMWEMAADEVPKACLQMHRFLVQNCEVKQKQKSAVEMVLKSKLIPKIFECLSSSREMKLEGCSRGFIPKLVDLIEKESYSTNKSNVFAPLQLLNFLYDKYAIWSKTKQFVKSRIDSLDLSSQQGPVLAVCLLNLIYRYDPSLINHLVETLERQFSNDFSYIKNRILMILEMAEKLGDLNPHFSAFFNDNRIKTKLLLSMDLDSPENAELVFEYLPHLNPPEINQFLQLKSQFFADEHWNELFRTIRNAEMYVASDEVWQCAIEKKSDSSDAIEFIGKQLRVLAEKKERVALGSKVLQILKQLTSVSSPAKLPPRQLLLAVPEILLSFSNAQYSLLPQNTTSALIPALILSFCFFFDGNELKVQKSFRSFLSKVEGAASVNDSSMDPIDMMERICEVIKSGTSPGCDLHFLKPSTSGGGGGTLLKTIDDVFSDISIGKSFPNPESFARTKERIVEMCSVLFESLAPQIQSFGDRGKTPFCQLALIIDKFLSSALPSSSAHSIIWKISERVTRGFGRMTEKWNSLFVVPRVLSILTSAKNHEDLLRRLMGVVQSNKILLTHLRNKKDFVQLEILANR